jgi:pimeloyl-ACP methyl ester carboxylesterase
MDSLDGGQLGEYAGAGGRRLRYRAIGPTDAAGGIRHRLLYLHGIESHGCWFLPVAQRLAAHGCLTWLLDRRGSGLNRREAPGDAESAGVLLEDVARFRDHVGDPPLTLVGLSWGGKLATAAALDRPENVESLVLVTPGLAVKVRPPARDLVRIAADRLFGRGRARIRVPIDDEMFSADPDVLELIRGDPARLREATSRLLLAGRALDRRVARGIASLRLPVLLCLASDDRIVDEPALLRLLDRRRAGSLVVRRFPGRHSIQLESPDALALALSAFLDETEDAA